VRELFKLDDGLRIVDFPNGAVVVDEGNQITLSQFPQSSGGTRILYGVSIVGYYRQK